MSLDGANSRMGLLRQSSKMEFFFFLLAPKTKTLLTHDWDFSGSGAMIVCLWGKEGETCVWVNVFVCVEDIIHGLWEDGNYSRCFFFLHMHPNKIKERIRKRSNVIWWNTKHFYFHTLPLYTGGLVFVFQKEWFTSHC